MKFIVCWLICLLRGHRWRFAYNFGIPLGCSAERYERLKPTSFPVHQCLRCKKYDCESDRLNLSTIEGFME